MSSQEILETDRNQWRIIQDAQIRISSRLTKVFGILGSFIHTLPSIIEMGMGRDGLGIETRLSS